MNMEVRLNDTMDRERLGEFSGCGWVVLLPTQNHLSLPLPCDLVSPLEIPTN